MVDRFDPQGIDAPTAAAVDMDDRPEAMHTTTTTEEVGKHSGLTREQVLNVLIAAEARRNLRLGR